jgi:hypothetical protein
VEDPNIERKLSGRTLQVYLYLQRKKEPSGIREVQRDLGLSSPSVADYQVEKLVSMGLAAKDNHGRVFVTRKVRVKALDSYVNFGRFSVPRLAFYASVFTAVAILYVAFSFSSLSIYGVAVPAAAAAVLWLEAWRMWKFSLIERAHSSSHEERQTLLQMLVPGIAALAVFVAAGSFLLQYSQLDYVEPTPVAPYDWEAARPTPEESAELSHQKVVAAGGSSGLSESVMTAMVFAGAAVAGFLVYIVARCRSAIKPVLITEREPSVASGTQDYLRRMR